MRKAAIAQLGERQTEDLEVPGSIPVRGTFLPPTLAALTDARKIGAGGHTLVQITPRTAAIQPREKEWAW